MDEREVRALLSRAAESVDATDDLAVRAERRYRRRRVRGRALTSAVVIVVVGAGVATAAAVGGDHRSAPPVVEPTPNSVVTPTTGPDVPLAPLDVRALGSISFVNAQLGYGIADTVVWRTDNGGSNWIRVGELEGAQSLYFANRTDGVAWGEGPLEVTTDGGLTWTVSDDGPVGNELAWADGRLWAFTSCEPGSCTDRPLSVSDDAGRTWRATAPLRTGYDASLVATSRRDAFVVGRLSEDYDGPWQLARTDNGGESWTFGPAPCPQRFTWRASLGFNGRVFVLACVSQAAGDTTKKQVFTSNDDGQTWRPAAYIPGQSAQLTNFGSTLISSSGRGALWYSTDDARTWKVGVPADGGLGLSIVPGVGAWAHPFQGPLWFSRDGARWEPLGGYFIDAVSFVDADRGLALARGGLAENYFLRSEDGGRTWQYLSAFGYRPLRGLYFETVTEGLIWGDDGVEFTRDGGQSWAPSPVERLVVIGWAGGRIWAYERCPDKAPCGPRPLFVSEDVGRTWAEVTTFRPIGFPETAFAAIDGSTAYLLDAASDAPEVPLVLRVTHDGGTTWVSREVPCATSDRRSVASNGRSLLVACADGEPRNPRNRMLRSIDDGASWESLPWRFDVQHFRTVANFGTVYLADVTTSGSFVSADDGASWQLPPFVQPTVSREFSVRPGVGVWVLQIGPVSRIWFSPDGVQWEARMRPRS